MTDCTIHRLQLVLLLLIAACSQSRTVAEDLQTFRGETMGTSYTVRVVAWEKSSVADLHAQIDQRLERVNNLMSTWRPDSELSQFNRHEGTDWYDVSPETAAVVSAALQVGRETNGAFDVTIGPLVNLWQFGPEDRARLPTEQELATAMQIVGYEQLEVRLDPPAMRKQRPEIYVDLSGIAKGFGVDEIARLLDQRGVRDYLVEIGGEVRTRGVKSDGSLWQVGIESPLAGRRTLQHAIAISGNSLATSGDYRNFREENGRRLSHILDPRTGQPVEHRLASVSVIAESCLKADALATALFVLGPEEAYNWATDRELAVLLIVREGNHFVERATPSFARQFPFEPFSAESNPGGHPMETFLFALLAFLVAVAAMAVGVIFKRRRLMGTCGGLANLQDSAGRPMCDVCHDPQPNCGGVEEGQRRVTEPEKDEAEGYNTDERVQTRRELK